MSFQVLYERGNVSSKTQNILQHELIATLKEALIPGIDFSIDISIFKICFVVLFLNYIYRILKLE